MQLWLSIPTFYIKGYDYDKRFVLVLVFIVINTAWVSQKIAKNGVLVLVVINKWCPKNCLKMGNTTLLISSSNYAKTPYKCVHRRRFVFRLRFLAIFLKLPRLMNEDRFPHVGDSIFVCLPGLYLHLRGTSF